MFLCCCYVLNQRYEARHPTKIPLPKSIETDYCDRRTSNRKSDVRGPHTACSFASATFLTSDMMHDIQPKFHFQVKIETDYCNRRISNRKSNVREPYTEPYPSSFAIATSWTSDIKHDIQLKFHFQVKIETDYCDSRI